MTLDEAAEHYSALLSPELFHLLTVTRGWPVDRFQRWVWETLGREFLE